MAYKKEIIKQALQLAHAGVPIEEICKELGIKSHTTVNRWIAKKPAVETTDSISNLKKQIDTLSKRKPTEAVARKIAMLSHAIDRLNRLKKNEEPRHPKRVPIIKHEAFAQELREKALHSDYGLREYQREFLQSDNQFRLVLKARQIGFSYVAGLEALIAAAGGRDQLFLSASEEQALILMKYVQVHAEKLGVEVSGSAKELKVNGMGTIKALAHNFRTVQGFTGDVWMDEFAWYANPEKIWLAFVPSIGAIEGRLTIMSTPFEEESLFYNLVHKTDKYFMFERFNIDIYRAIEDGLKFDLEVMRALFDEDTWATAYECQFVDDESSFFPISLIKSCVDVMSEGYHMPDFASFLRSGYDIGRKKDRSALASLEPQNGKYSLAVLDVLSKATFATQKTYLFDHLNLFKNSTIKIDMTGIGMNLAEDVEAKHPDRAEGVYFTATSKELMVLNLKKMFEDGKITIPNDPALIADIHAIKRKAGQKRMLYDADRNAYGHADRFWALALAAKELDFFKPDGQEEDEDMGALIA